MSNFLDLQCPQCGNQDRIRIAGTVWLDLTSEGTTADNSDHEFDPTSAAMCRHCDFAGTVADLEQRDVLVPAVRFRLGQLVMTPGVVEIAGSVNLGKLIDRHHAGDWGSIDPADKETNDDAVKQGNRILSAYPIDPALPCKGYGENTVWIITEADRSVTTLLLPDEY